MTSRRNFFRSLAVATAALYLRLAPETISGVAKLGKLVAEEGAKTWVAHHREWVNGRLVYSADSNWTLF